MASRVAWPLFEPGLPDSLGQTPGLEPPLAGPDRGSLCSGCPLRTGTMGWGTGDGMESPLHAHPQSSQPLTKLLPATEDLGMGMVVRVCSLPKFTGALRTGSAISMVSRPCPL